MKSPPEKNIAACLTALLLVAVVVQAWSYQSALNRIASTVQATVICAGYLLFATHLRRRRRAEVALSDSRARYKLLADHSTDMISRLDATGKVLYVSPACRALLGREPSDLIGQNCFADVHPDDMPALNEGHARGLQDSGTSVSRFRIRRADDSWVWVEAIWRYDRDPRTGQVSDIFCSTRDISERRRMEEQLVHDSTHDALTGLPNRVLLYERLRNCITPTADERDDERHFALLFLDLDRFKLINDSLGHDAGDELLKQVARRLERCVAGLTSSGPARGRSTHTVARLGGDEFVILLDPCEAGASQAVTLADRLQTELARPIQCGGREVSVSTSVGIVHAGAGACPYTDPGALLRDADAAMYTAKGSGRARHAVFDVHMHQAAIQKLELESDLHRAIEREEFALVYQPIVCLESRRLVGYEALVRWNHPTRGLVPPDQFIPAAEENGLILPLGLWVLNEACRQLAEWKRLHPFEARGLTVSVNVSRRQLSDPTLMHHLNCVLTDHALSASSLKLELTESAIVDDPHHSAKLMSQIRELGIGLQIDDFGTGYSSLSCLHHFPLNGLKIDRQFLTNAADRRDYVAVILAIVQLAHNLGMTVTAEGLESIDQVVMLQALNCDQGQGYYFARPMTAEQAGRYLVCPEGRVALSA